METRAGGQRAGGVPHLAMAIREHGVMAPANDTVIGTVPARRRALRRQAAPARVPGLRLVRPSSVVPAGLRRAESISTRTLLIGLVVALCASGLVMVLSASAYTSLVDYGSVWSIFERQVLWMAMGGVVFVVFARVPYQRWQRLRRPLLVFALALLVLVLVPHLGASASGSSRWIGFGTLRMQPSELMKLALAVYAADLLARRSQHAGRTGAVVVPLVAVTGMAAFLVLLQPDLGTAIVLGSIAFSCLFAVGVPGRTVAEWMGGAVVLAAVAALAAPYRRARLLSFVNPMAHRLGSGYQVVQSLVGLSSGRLFGLGLGNGREKWGLLPNPHTDFIFSVIGEETGLVGAVLVVALFTTLALVGLRAARRAPDRFGMVLAVAVTCWITAEAIINMGAATGILPVTGIPLPFISFGGSSLLVVMAGTGMLVNVAAQERPATGSGAARSGAASSGQWGSPP